MKSLPTPTSVFTKRKTKIIAKLALPDDEYTDASPKGSVDIGIRQLIDDLNAQEGLVTTSSCAGRASVYLEGKKTSGVRAEGVKDGGEERASSTGGKGGGEWLFVSHDPVEEFRKGEEYAELFGLRMDGDGLGLRGRLIHFKFEPMVSLIR